MHDRLPHQGRPIGQIWERGSHLQHGVGQPEPLLQTALNVLWRQKWLAISVSLTLFAALIALILSLPERYTAYATVMIDPRERSPLSGDSLTPALLGDEPAVASEMEVLRSRDIVQHVIASLGLANVEEFTRGLTSDTQRQRAIVEEVSDRIGIANLNESRVIEISFTAADPVLAARVTNTLVDRYLAVLAGRNAVVARQTSDWLAGRLDELKTELVAMEEEAEQYREETVTDIGVGSAVLRQKISETSSAVVIAGTAVSRAEARHAEYVNILAADGARAALGASDVPEASSLLTREAEAREALQTLSARYGPSHEVLDRPRRDLAALTRLVETAADEQRDRLATEAELARANVRSLNSEMARLQAQLSRASEREIRQRSLDREVEATQGVYSTLLTRLRETERVPAAVTSAWQVSTADAPTKKSEPRRSMLAAAALLFSCAAGAGAAFLRENRRTAPRRLGRRVMWQLDPPWVAYVPEERPVRRRSLTELIHLVRSDHRSRFARSVRQLASEVLASTACAQGLGRVVWVTSVAPGVGKTTLATSLAAVIAEPGRSVLLVDANAARPRLDEIADDATAGGALGAALVERNRDPWMRLVTAGGPDGLSVLPLEEEPPGLVEAQRVEEVLHGLSERFDVVIVDGEAFQMNAPLVPIPGGVSTLLVARLRDIDPDELAELRRRLASAGSTVIGVVLNRCPAGSISGAPR